MGRVPWLFHVLGGLDGCGVPVARRGSTPCAEDGGCSALALQRARTEIPLPLGVEPVSRDIIKRLTTRGPGTTTGPSLDSRTSKEQRSEREI